MLRVLTYIPFGWLFLFSILACGELPSLEAETSTEENSADTAPPPLPSHPDDVLLIAAIDVGQGDATLLVTPSGAAVLIDAGPPDAGREVVLPTLAGLGIAELSWVILSHYDADHVGGTVEVLSGEDGVPMTEDDWWPSKGIYDRGENDLPDTEAYITYAELALGRRKALEAGTVIGLADGIELTCLIANGLIAKEDNVRPAFPDAALEENDRSMGLLVTYGDFRYWTGGDLPAGKQEDSGDGSLDMEGAVAPLVIASGTVDVLHLHHHGSAGSTSDAFLEALKPRAAIISAGADNHYGHPRQEVVVRLAEHGIDSYATETSDDALYPGLSIVHGSIFIEAEASGNFSINGKRYKK